MSEPDNPNPYESPQEVAPGSGPLPRRVTTLEIMLKVFALIFFLAAIPVCTFITFFATCISIGRTTGAGVGAVEPTFWVWAWTAIVGLGLTALWIWTLSRWIKSVRPRS